MKLAHDFEGDNFFMPVFSVDKGVKKAAPLFETDIFALISQSDSEKAKQNTVYIFDAQRREVVNQKTITSTVSDVFFAKLDQKSHDGPSNRGDGVVFFGADEVYICDQVEFTELRVIKTGANAGICHDMLQTKNDKRLAFSDEAEGNVKMVNLNWEFEEQSFAPFKEKKPISFLSFCELVKLAYQGGVIAIADSNGSYVTLFNLQDLAPKNTFFLGYSGRTFKAISVSPNVKNLACLSNKGTLHIFEIEASACSGGGSSFS